MAGPDSGDQGGGRLDIRRDSGQPDAGMQVDDGGADAADDGGGEGGAVEPGAEGGAPDAAADAAQAMEGGADPGLDAAAELDSGPDPDSGQVSLPDAGGADADAGEAVVDGSLSEPQEPLDCTALNGEGVELCDASEDRCGAVFTNGMGCTATCALAGLVCVSAFENVEAQCARDDARPELGCDSGHDSDYCDCRRAP